MRNRELVDSGVISNQTYYQSVTDFYNYDWYGKKYFRFYSRQSDNMEFYNNRNYWTFYYPDQSSNNGTEYYEFIEEIGVIVVDKWDGNYLLDEIHYYKTPTEEWGTAFSHSCSSNTGIAETQSTSISIYPNPAEEVIQIQSPLKIDRIQFYDLQGRLLKSEVLNGRTSMNASDLENGVYLIEILNQNKILHRQKLIVKK
jgi:hypothetical protein